MNVEQILGLYNYWIVIFLMMTGFYIVIARDNLIKTVIGLNIFQISVILLYVSMGKVSGGTAPIVPPSMVVNGHAVVAHADHGHHTDGESDHVEGAHGHHEEDSHHADNEHGHSASDGHAHSDGQPHHAETGHADGAEHTIADGAEHSSADSHSNQADVIYSNPLPSVLMLTAIVVGVATTALALALIVRIREDYGTIEEDEILELDRAA